MMELGKGEGKEKLFESFPILALGSKKMAGWEPGGGCWKNTLWRVQNVGGFAESL